MMGLHGSMGNVVITSLGSAAAEPREVSLELQSFEMLIYPQQHQDLCHRNTTKLTILLHPFEIPQGRY